MTILITIFITLLGIGIVLFISKKNWKNEDKNLFISVITIMLTLPGTAFLFIDRISPPSIDIKSITPLLVIRNKTESKSALDYHTPEEWSLYLLCQIQNKNTSVYVKDITIRGSLPVRLSDCDALHSTVGQTIDDIKKWVDTSKPYMQIDWSALLTESGGICELKNNEPRLLSFSLWHPGVNGQREYRWQGGKENYLGTLNPAKKPALINGVASAAEFLKDCCFTNDYKINCNLLLNSIKWEVHFNNQSMVITKNKIHDLITVTDYEWRTLGPIELLKRRDVLNTK